LSVMRYVRYHFPNFASGQATPKSVLSTTGSNGVPTNAYVINKQ
jgi:hypothetical protein